MPRPRPDIDLPAMEEAALEADRPIVVRPGLDDHVERFPLALVHPHRVAVRGRDLVWHAAHEPRLQPAARQHIDHRHLLRDAHRLAAVGDRVAEDQQPRLGALPRQHRQHQRRGRIDAGGGLVMLVEHDLQPLVLGEQPLVEVAMIEIGADARIVVPVRQRHADRIVGLRRRQQMIGGFAEMPGPHCDSSRVQPLRNASAASANAAGCSICGTWPALRRSSRCAHPAAASRSLRDTPPRSARRLRRAATAPGQRTRCSRCRSLGLCMYGSQASRAVVSRLRSMTASCSSDSLARSGR